MSEADNKTIAECPYCQKKGLPILPLRYATTRTDSRNGEPVGPALSESFGEGVKDIALPDGQAYTLRLMRGGYLYVFNETRGSWYGYVVTEKGYLFPYVAEIKHNILAGLDLSKEQEDIDAMLQPPAQKEEFTCTKNPEHEYPGRCITIPNADQADNIYLAFSDTAWTKRVWKEHATNAQVDDSGTKRRDHMRKLSLAEWRGGSAKHVAPLTELESRVAESKYQWMSQHLTSAALIQSGAHLWPSPFGHSPAPIYGIDEQVKGLVTWAEAQAEPLNMPPLMIALEDPVAIAAELNELAKIRTNEWAEEPERKKKHESALMIGSIRQAIEHGGELKESEWRKTQVAILGTLFPAHVGAATSGKPGYMGVVEGMERVGRIDESELDAIHANAWEKYQAMYNEDARSKYLEQEYPEELAGFEQENIVPLDKAYLDWFKGERLKQYLLCNYDRHDVESGIGFTGALYSMILDASGRKVICDYLDQCLNEDPMNPDAFVIRGLVFNQDKLAEKWMEAANKGVEPYGGWDGLSSFLYGAFRSHLVEALGKFLKKPMLNVSNYSYELSGVMTRYLKRLYDLDSGRLIASVSEYRIVAILGAIAKNDAPNYRLVSVRTEPTRLQAARILQRITAALADKESRVVGASDEISKLFDPISGKRYPYQGVLLVEETQAVRLEMSGTLSPEQFDGLMQQNVRILSRLEAGSYFVGSFLSALTLGSAWDKIRTEPGLKSTLGFASGLVSIAGGSMEGAGIALRSHSWWGGRLAKPVSVGATRVVTRAQMLGFSGKMIGTVGAIIGGVLAIWDGAEEWNLNRKYSITMMALGGGMILAGIFMFFAATALVGFFLSLVLALIMYVVGFMKTDEIQLWLDRAIEFGHNIKGERYQRVEQQREAMKALGQDGA